MKAVRRGTAGARARALGQEGAWIHRELDHRVRRAMAAGLVGAALLAGGVVGAVALKIQQTRLAYRLDALRTARTQAEETTRRLRVEVASLSALARIEDKARTELGMVAPGRGQVLLAREYVAGGTGLSRVIERPTLTARSDVPGAGIR